MSEQVGSLEALFRKHREDPTWPDTCICETEVPDVDESRREGHYEAHAAAEVRAWIGEVLAGDGLRAEVAEELDHPHWCESNYTRGCTCRDDRLESARAALSAVRDHLAAEGLGEVDRS